MKPLTHGTKSGYSHFRCRCAACTKANREERMRYYRGAPNKRDNNPPRLVRDGKLCCLICQRPYADHRVTEACFREVR